MARRHAARAVRTSRLSRKVRAVLAGGLVLGVGAAATLAAWTDSEFGTATFTASRFDTESSINGTAFADNPNSPGATMTVTGGGLSPNQRNYSFIDVRSKAGSIAGTLALGAPTVTNTPPAAAPATPTLGGTLQYRVVATAPGAACTAAAFTAGATYIVGGPSALVPLATPGAATVPLSAAGATAPSTAVRLCFDVFLPSTAANSLQGWATTSTWQITATSTS